MEDVFSSAEARSKYEAALADIKQKLEGTSALDAQIIEASLARSTVSAKLDVARKGQTAIAADATEIEADAKFIESQCAFYDDGSASVKRLYAILLDELAKLDRSVEEQRLNRLRRLVATDAGDQAKLKVLKEHDEVKAELDEVTRQWQAADGELQLFMEKARSHSNPFFAAIQSDYDALREYRKFRYFSEMVEKLRKQLASAKPAPAQRPYKPERLYAAVLRHRVPLKEWVSFATEQITRPGSSDVGTPMEEDTETQQVFVVLSFLAERAKRAEQQTWPE